MRMLVTGGGGFLGSHLARRLLKRGDHAAVLGRGKYPNLDNGIEVIQADIRDPEAVNKALKDRDAVFHAAALPGIWGDRDEFYSINVEGTRNVIEACWENSVKKLVFTSSPSVVFDHSDMENVDESVPYPKSYLCSYPETKAIAERLVTNANGVNGLSTVSLRPHLIWGPGDPHLVPRIIKRARRKRLVQVGEGKNLVDMIYIDNAVEAHILACDALSPESSLAGKSYFVSDGNPVNLWSWIKDLLSYLNVPPPTRTISYRTASIVGKLLEGIYSLFQIRREPPMTRFIAAQLATSHYFDISRARKDFGYSPVVSQEEGMKRLIESIKVHREG